MAKVLGIHSPLIARNKILNGGMDFWQSVAGAAVSVNTASTTSDYTADMFSFASEGATNKEYSVVRSTDVPTVVQSGFSATYSYLFTVDAAIASFAAGDLVEPCRYKMEGLDYEKLHAQTAVISFWMKASVAGVYSVALRNDALDRSYVTTVTQNSGGAWEFKSIIVTLDSSGSWNFDNTTGLIINFGAFAGSTFQTATLNQWQAGNFTTASTATNYFATNGATIRLSMVSMTLGRLGLGAKGFERAAETEGEELALVQRYYEKSYEVDIAPGSANQQDNAWKGVVLNTSDFYFGDIFFQTIKRTVPTITLFNPKSGTGGQFYSYNADSAQGNSQVIYSGSRNFTVNSSNTGLAAGHREGTHWVANARL